MIGSFWNLCRACPSMPLDKQLHSEYRSTYRWHEFNANSRPEVVRRAPMPNQLDSCLPIGVTNEPPLPRRKKCPELAYKSHEFIICSSKTSDVQSNNIASRARSEERGTPSRRSKSEGPAASADRASHIQSGVNGAAFGNSSAQPANLHELEPLVNDVEDPKFQAKKNIENRITGAFSLVDDRNNQFTLKKDNFGFAYKKEKTIFDIGKKNAFMPANTTSSNIDEWYKEVVELRKKAGEYKSRGWGIEIDSNLYQNQRELWDQVSKRSSLSALSLASTIQRPISKAEKEKQNKRFLPIATKKSDLSEQELSFDNKNDSTLTHRCIRHHLERTTGQEDGTLLPSPTREKLMPAIPRSRETDSQWGSPKKSATSRHASPQKGSPQKGSPKKVVKNADMNEKATGGMVPNHYASPPPLKISDEPVVKSPPEPTRVKSPEQIIIRSPDPVNWTVPLDTGKTFTVTQNVKEGESYSRPQSEIKASTPMDKFPPAPQSAPPELTEQARMDAWKGADYNDVISSTTQISGEQKSNMSTLHNKPACGSNVGDPTADVDVPATIVRNNTTDVLEQARDRFDRFWNSGKQENI